MLGVQQIANKLVVLAWLGHLSDESCAMVIGMLARLPEQPTVSYRSAL